MQLPNFDEPIKRAVNELTEEESGMEKSYAFNHELLCYGLQSVAHAYIMQIAKEISSGGISLDEFIQKYDIKFGGVEKFQISVQGIKSDGIFIPNVEHYKDDGRTFWLFNDDHRNRIYRAGEFISGKFVSDWKDQNYADALTRRVWQPSDLENLNLIEQGLKFGRDMWKTCVIGFDRYKQGHQEHRVPAQTQKVTDLGEKLINYYSAIIEPPPSE